MHYTLQTLMIATFLLIFGVSVGNGQEDYVIAYRAVHISDTLPDIAQEFLESIAIDLQQYSVEIILEEWRLEDERPENAVAYLSFSDILNGERIITGTSFGITPSSKNLAELSPILEDNKSVGVNLADPNASAIASGLILYAIGELDTAEELLTRVDKSNTNYDDVSFYLGNLRLLAGDLEGAISHFESRVWNEIGRFLGVNLAWTYFQIGEVENSFDLINEAIAESIVLQENSTAYLLSIRAQFHGLNFDYDNAISDMNEAIDIYEESNLGETSLAELYTIRGEIIFLIYEWDRVEENFDMAIELIPTYAPAYFQRGVLYYTMARREDAQADFEYYLELEPDGIYAEQAQGYIESIEVELDALGG